jgi:putative flavoprotein involved in K+ transport
MDVETVVVGAGHAGLAASWALSDQGLEHMVVEQGRVGETWRADRWRTFRLNTARCMSRLPGDEPAAGERDGFDTAREFADVLTAYARGRGLPVREGTGPAAIRRSQDGYVVDTADEAFAARTVVVATGFQKIPVRPAYAAALDPRLLCGGRRVVLATSRVGRVPRRYRGRDALAWWRESGFYDRRRDEADDAVLRMRQPLLSGNDDGHTLSLQLLHGLGVVLAGRIEAASGEEVRFDATAEANAAFGDHLSAELCRDIDAHIERRGIDAPPPEPDPADEPVPGLGRDAPASLRLDREGIGTVIWCCGMRPRLDAVAPLGLGADVEHRDGVTAQPGLYLIGAPWLATRKSGIIWGAAEDAARIAAHIASGRRAKTSAAPDVT